MTITRTDSTNPDFQSLIKLLDAELLGNYGEQQSFYDQFNKTTAIRHVVIAYVDELPVGCGAFKKFDDEAAELKRMYVKNDYRGQQISIKMMEELEQWAKETGFTAFVLETGNQQDRAIAVYQKNDYSLIPNYGQYAGVETSICMKKQLR